ncbi:MAG TPA: SMI1/KNR4 family protein [Candidatus Saccharimonadales bacterium]|nr:SMI1/KNR4 family protein [Candidatus Saccharimonadales bacterium]
MTESEWIAFLTELNRELLSYEEVVQAASPEALKKGWLGFPGIDVAELIATERRLGIRLPPSYREFLKASNGWRYPSISISDLRPLNKLSLFPEQNQEWIDAFVRPSADLPRISDEDYFVYGKKQECVKFRPEYLQTAWQVSEVDDSAVVLLNPQVVTPEGEWETWLFANWLPGAVRYRSFGEWLAQERLTCRKMLKPLPEEKIKQPITIQKTASVKKAQAAARDGRTSFALKSLEAFAAKGEDSAAASLAVLYAFLGKWENAIANAGRLIAHPQAVQTGNVFDEMILLLGRAGHASRQWGPIVKVAKAAWKANARRCATLCREQKENAELLKTELQRKVQIFRNLIIYAQRGGTEPHYLLPTVDAPNPFAGMSPKERKAWYKAGVKNVDSARPDLKKNPAGKKEYFFSLAKGVLEDEALKLYEAHGRNFLMRWQAAEYVAPIYARRGKKAVAWQAIQRNLKHWWPVDHAQIAPLALLLDDDLQQLMTPKRCKEVLATPRGRLPSVAKKD